MKLRLLLLFSLISLISFGQNAKSDTIPQLIQKAFAKEYPDSKVKNWETIQKVYYANTKIDGQEARVSFSADGQWIETVYKTNEKELPGRIGTYLSTNLAAYKVLKAEYTESKNNGAFYYLTINKSGSEPDAELFFDVSGNFMKKNEFHPIDQPISTGREVAEARVAAEKAAKKEAEERRAALLKMDRTVYENELPQAVLNNFKKKFPKVEETHWDSLDNIYSAHWEIEEYKNRADFNAQGDWLATMDELGDDQLFAPIGKYLEDNYPDLKFNTCERTTKRDRSVTWYVEMVNKPKKGEQELITKVYFDKSGKFIREERPKTTVSTEDESDVTITGNEDEEEDGGTEGDDTPARTGEKVKPGELPSAILKYVSENYPECKIKEATFDEFEEHGTAYQVIVRKEGLNQKSNELYFNDKGGLIYDPNPPLEKQPKKTTQAATPKKKKVEVEEEEEEEDKPASNMFSAREDDVPQAIMKSFKKRFPKAEEAEWYENDGKFEVEFMNNETKTRLGFAADGMVIVTKTEMDPGALMGPIQKHLDENYPQYKVTYAEKVIRKDRKNYFYLELFTRKRNVSPTNVQLYYDKVGRLMEQAPE